jgi:TrmH family RNA methyltransferase
MVRAARPPNVAAACRAMKNMGLHELRLVEPPDGLARPEVRALAFGAWDVLDGARLAPTLAEAVADATLVVGTSARPSTDAWTPRRLAAEAAARAGAGRIALVFGPEATGLRNDELALCHLRVVIPTDPGQPSLNLAQAVLVLAYELFVASREAAPAAASARATVGEIEAGLASLRDALVAIGYLNPDNPDAVLSELRRLVARAAPSPREVSLLRGLARQILWAAGRIARGGGADG